MHRFDFAITVSVISIMMTLMLGSLNNLENNVEQINHHTELNNLRLGLMENLVHMSVHHQTVNLSDTSNQNPMNFIKEIPSNYIGELPAAPVGQKKVWYFDTRSKQLVYMYNDGTTSGYKLVSTANKGGASLLSMNGLDLVAANTK